MIGIPLRSRSASTRVAVACAGAAIIVSVAASSGCERVKHWSSGPEEEGTSAPAASGAVGPASSVGTGQPEPASKAAVLGAVSVCAIELYGDFVAAAAALSAATALAADTGDPGDLDAARAAWRTAIDTWQRAEVVRVGPAGPATLPAGRSLRDEVYSWPLVSRCLVEQTIVSESFLGGDFAETSLVNVRGLAAAEYLLFFEGKGNACSTTSSINATGAWAALSPAELSSRKASYVAIVASGVEARAREIDGGWSDGGGSFGALLASAGESSSPFESEQSALNAVSDGLFYIEIEVKDAKLGRPLGKLDCDESECLDAVESPFARRSVRHIENNLLGFARVFDGCGAADGIGFDDLLVTAGAGDLALAMRGNLEAAIAAAAAVEQDDLAAAIVEDRPRVDQLHVAIKRVTDDLKTDMVSVLDLEPPAVVEGDND